MARKTVEVSKLVEMVNAMLLTSTNTFGDTKMVRQGAMNMLESVLHDTGNYRGFRQLRPSEVPAGELPGIAVECVDGTSMDQRFPAGKVDSTRVHYFN